MKALLDDIEAMVTCESPSSDAAAVARAPTWWPASAPNASVRSPSATARTCSGAGETGRKCASSGTTNRPPLPESASAELFSRASRLAAELRFPALTGAAVGGGSDDNFTAGVGVPTLDGLGAVGGGAHGADEHVLVDRLADRTALLTALIRDLS